MLVLLSSCGGKEKHLADPVGERDSLPSMQTRGVSSLVSDSGVIRYKILAEEWLVYDKRNPSKWAFEKGIFLEKFNDSMQVDAKIKADTAYYYDKQKLWDLRGHVSVRNQRGEKFDTYQLFWNQNTQQVYSEKFIRIQQEDKVITGYGFKSNQQFTDYVIHNTAGIFPVEEHPNDSVSSQGQSAEDELPKEPAVGPASPKKVSGSVSTNGQSAVPGSKVENSGAVSQKETTSTTSPKKELATGSAPQKRQATATSSKTGTSGSVPSQGQPNGSAPQRRELNNSVSR